MALSVVYLLRISDLASIRWAWLSKKGQFSFYYKKINKQMVTYELSPLLDRWRTWMWEHRAGADVESQLFPGRASTIRFCHTKLSRSSPVEGQTWHPLKRCGAAAFLAMGAFGTTLCSWGRWRGVRQA